MLQDCDKMSGRIGTFYGVGIGPGDPDLITLKALKILRDSHVICAPRSSEDRESLALSIVKKAIKKDFKIIEPIFPMIKNTKTLRKYWDRAAKIIFDELKKGKNVAFVTMGDPLFYSTFEYVFKTMKKNFPKVKIKTIPGVTSLSACLAELNLPLAEKDEKIAIMPATYGIKKLKEFSKFFNTIILMKVSRNFDKIVNSLDKIGLEKNAIFVSRCGSEHFFSSGINSMRGKKVDYFSMVIIKGYKK